MNSARSLGKRKISKSQFLQDKLNGYWINHEVHGKKFKSHADFIALLKNEPNYSDFFNISDKITADYDIAEKEISLEKNLRSSISRALKILGIKKNKESGYFERTSESESKIQNIPFKFLSTGIIPIKYSSIIAFIVSPPYLMLVANELNRIFKDKNFHATYTNDTLLCFLQEPGTEATKNSLSKEELYKNIQTIFGTIISLQ